MNSTFSRRSGFTIVELLVVIVVIGILSALTMVSYSNMSSQAVVASIKSDLSTSSRLLKAFNVDNGEYPQTVSTDCVANPDSLTNKCLKLSAGNVLDNPNGYTRPTPQTFNLRIKNGSKVFEITQDSSPDIAPITVVINGSAFTNTANWGAEYGTWYDPDSGDSGCDGDVSLTTRSTFNLNSYVNGSITNGSVSWSRTEFVHSNGGRNKYLKRDDTGAVLQTWDTTVDVFSSSAAGITTFLNARKGSTATFFWDADLGFCGGDIFGSSQGMSAPTLTFTWKPAS